MSSDDDHFPATPATTGWYPVSDGTDQETFWDGSAWTKRRQYRFGSPFLEIPLHRSDPPLASTSDPTTSSPTSTTPDTSPSSTAPSNLNRNGSSVESMTRAFLQNPPPQTEAPSPSFRTSRQRVRFIQLIYLFVFIGFIYYTFGRRTGPNPQKYLAGLIVLGLVVSLFMRFASSGARRSVRAQESDRRPQWPFRYLSRLTDGLQGQRLASFIGGIRTQPRIGPMGFNASVPMVRLSLFSNGVRVGPSSSLLSMSVPTWEARFEELDVIQAIGRLKGITTGILFRKSQSHEWVIFWSLNREQVFTTLEQLGVIVSREPIRIRVGSQWRVNQFVENELRPSEPSVLGSVAAATSPSLSPSNTSSPLVFATPLSSTVPKVNTLAPDDKRWPGYILPVAGALFVLSILLLMFNLVPTVNRPATSASNGGGVATTVSTPLPVVTISPTAWRTSVENNVRYFRPPLAGIPDSVRQLRYNYGVTEDSFNLIDLTSDLDTLNSDCATIQNLAVYAPSPALAKDAAKTSTACSDLVSVDQLDLKSSDNKWTAKLASNDEHWLVILKERLAVLKNVAANER
jgi:hypothetical protein